VLREKKLPVDLASALQPVLSAEEKRVAGSGGPAKQDQVMALASVFKLHKGRLPADIEANLDKLVVAARPPLWVVDWDVAAGALGQFIGFFKLALFGIVMTVAQIAIIILMIGITIATLQRTQVIGTIRAIGGQREFVLSMVVVESMVLSAVFATLGIAVGAAIVSWLGATGIPAFRDELYFFFSGPRLLPQLSGQSVLIALALIVGATLVSVLVPAIIATRISPLRAMQSSD
jgi:ABC-type lipoprotein release transport system permease subunit